MDGGHILICDLVHEGQWTLLYYTVLKVIQVLASDRIMPESVIMHIKGPELFCIMYNGSTVHKIVFTQLLILN
jgi:hypothetical protein